MIYTITLNPSLDYIVHISQLQQGETNRSSNEEIYPGGKGFNVALMLHKLGIESTAIGFVAGFTGHEIERLLKKREVKTELYRLDSGNSRINVKIKAESETEINGTGATITEEKLDLLMEKVSLMEKDDVLVLAGSIPPSLDEGVYHKIITLAKQKAVMVVVDATGALLKNTLADHPFLIKPNLAELEMLCDCKVQSLDDLLACVARLQQLGALNVLVSLGKKGAILVDSSNQAYYCQAGQGQLKNSVGSGDSMVAGFIAGYMKTQNLQEALRLGSACGSATAFSEDIGDFEQVEAIYRQLAVRLL